MSLSAHDATAVVRAGASKPLCSRVGHCWCVDDPLLLLAMPFHLSFERFRQLFRTRCVLACTRVALACARLSGEEQTARRPAAPPSADAACGLVLRRCTGMHELGRCRGGRGMRRRRSADGVGGDLERHSSVVTQGEEFLVFYSLSQIPMRESQTIVISLQITKFVSSLLDDDTCTLQPGIVAGSSHSQGQPGGVQTEIWAPEPRSQLSPLRA